MRAAEPWSFQRAPGEPKITYEFQSNRYTVADYLNRNPVTGLLIAKDDTILLEHYQYARSDRHRFLSQSMAKTITAMLIGIAVSKGSVKSIDDTAATHVPKLAGTEYGRTRIRDLLHMASGVDFSERLDGKDDLSRFVADIFGLSRTAMVVGVAKFNTRVAPPGTRWNYASVETLVLGRVLREAIRRPITDYLREKIWQPIGAEAEASWAVDRGQEVTYCCFNAGCYETTLGWHDCSPMTGCGWDANSFRGSGFWTQQRCGLPKPISLRVLRPPSTGMAIRYGFSLAQGESSCSGASTASLYSSIPGRRS